MFIFNKKITSNLLFLLLVFSNLNSNFKTIKEGFLKKVNNSFPDWVKKQVDKDLSLNKSLLLTPEMLNWFENTHLAMRYKVSDGKLQIYQSPVKVSQQLQLDRIMRMNEIFTVLSKIIKLPDFDIIVSLEDAINDTGFGSCPGPLFASCKNKIKDKNVVLIPDFYFMSLYPYYVQKVKKANTLYNWQDKKNKAFWIGATTGGHYNLENYNNYPRTKLVKLSFEYPDLIYARFHLLTQMDETLKPNLIKYLSPKVSIEEHMKYKYQITVDGNGTSYPRIYWQLFGNSVILKQESEYIQWYSDALEDKKHYILFKNDLSDLLDKISWCEHNDDFIKGVITQANNFAENNLTVVDNLIYLYYLLSEVSKIQAQK